MVNCSYQLFHLAVKRFLPESFTQKALSQRYFDNYAQAIGQIFVNVFSLIVFK